MTTTIHPTALVSSKAEIAEGVHIGPYCVVSGKVKIGPGTLLKAFVRIADHVEIGSDCILFENAVVGREPQDVSFKNEESWVHIGNRVTIREGVTIHRASGEGNVTYIGDDCLIMEGCHIAHNVRMEHCCVLANKTGLAGHVIVGDHVNFGGMAGVHQFVHIGSYSMIGGLSKIVKDVPPFTLVDGRPGRVRGLNSVGLRRNGFTAEQRTLLKRYYQILYRSGLPLREALERLEAEFGREAMARQIIDFARSAKRGLTPWFRRGGGWEAE